MSDDSTPKTPSTRDSIRAGILGTNNFRSEVMSLFGQKVEIRQPSLDAAMKMADHLDGSSNALVNFMIEYCYVPGTNQKVFEEGDREVIKGLPFGPDVQKFQSIALELAGISEDAIADETKN